MICRLQGDPLHQHAIHVLLTYSSLKTSWFVQVRDLLLQYQLPHPLNLLLQPLKKEEFKKLIKARVLDHWETKLRAEASLLPSLVYFNPNFMSLTKPHKLWTTAGKNSYEVSKSRIQLLFLSSQYPCAQLSRHWSHDNPQGICSHGECSQDLQVESREHILLHCSAYSATRTKLIATCLRVQDSVTHSLITGFLLGQKQRLMQCLLDCSVIPEVICAAQCYGDHIYENLFYLSRTWCFSLDRERMKRLKKWNFQ